MKLLVAGAHGMIGAALRHALTATGNEVVSLVRGRADDPVGDAVPWNPAQGSIDTARLRARGPFDAVVNLSGAPLGDGRWTARRRGTIVDSRIDSTRTLVTGLARLDPAPRVLVSASAVGYYGDRGDEELTEESTPGAGFLAKLCHRWESEAERASEHMRVVRIRSGIVLSTRGGALARQLPLFRLGLGGRLGSGEQYLPWISLADEVGVIRAAIDNVALGGPINAVAPGQITNAQFTAAIGRALRRPAILAVPGPVLSLALGRQMTAEMLLASQRVVPAALTAAGHRFTDPDIDGALSRLLAAGA